MSRKCWILISFVPLLVLHGCSGGGSTAFGTGGSGGAGGESSSSNGSSSGSTSNGSSSGSTSTSSSGGSSSTSSSSGSGGSGGSAPVIQYCVQACSIPANCVIGGGSPAYDADNYDCNAGACIYSGCNTDAECAASNPNFPSVCRTYSAGAPKACATACQTPSDCAIGGGAAYDADNYDCVNGGCIYSGCNSDAECTSLGQGYVCRSSTPGGIPYCFKACQQATDCSVGNNQPAFDADNYSCSQGFCEYTGCNSNAECAANFPSGTYVCH